MHAARMSSTRSTIFRAAALDRLSSTEQLDARLQIVSPRAWLALGTLVVLLLGLLGWAVFGRIAVRVEAAGWFSAAGDGAAAELFVPAREADRVQAGMRVEIVPATQARPGGGFLSGRVASSATRLASETELAGALRDPMQAQVLAREAAMTIAVTVTDGRAPAGMPCTARIVIGEERPIAWLVPGWGRAGR